MYATDHIDVIKGTTIQLVDVFSEKKICGEILKKQNELT
jgi:hypothetical protein